MLNTRSSSLNIVPNTTVRHHSNHVTLPIFTYVLLVYAVCHWLGIWYLQFDSLLCSDASVDRAAFLSHSKSPNIPYANRYIPGILTMSCTRVGYPLPKEEIYTSYLYPISLSLPFTPTLNKGKVQSKSICPNGYCPDAIATIWTNLGIKSRFLVLFFASIFAFY